MNSIKAHFPEQEYWYNRVLRLTSGIDEIGSFRWELCGCLALMWALTYACIYKGAKSTGKAAYFTGSVPLIVLLRIKIYDFYAICAARIPILALGSLKFKKYIRMKSF